MILTPDQIHALTGKTRPSAQCRALDHMGIGYVRRPDGSRVVTWESVGRRVDGQRKAVEPKWEMVR